MKVNFMFLLSGFNWLEVFPLILLPSCVTLKSALEAFIPTKSLALISIFWSDLFESKFAVGMFPKIEGIAFSIVKFESDESIEEL